MNKTSSVQVGTQYELFVQSVYKALLAAEGVETVDVKHNITLPGNSGCEHQIDIYWEFRVGGHAYRTAIECKAFDKTVSVGRVRDFFGVLTDVPGLKGIFATLVGYQSGARLFAQHYGIELRELRAPTADDWEGRVKEIVVNVHIVTPRITGFRPRATSAYLQTIPEGSEIRIDSSMSTDDDLVFNAAGEPVATWNTLLQRLPASGKAETNLTTFLDFHGHELRVSEQRIPIEGIDIDYDVEVATETVRQGAETLARAIVKDVNSGEITFVRNDGRVHRPSR